MYGIRTNVLDAKISDIGNVMIRRIRYYVSIPLLVLSISVSLYIFYASVGSIELEKSKYLNLNPYPDVPEYLAMANTWLEGNGYRIKIGDDYLPSRYPPGLSIAYSWVARITGANIVKVPYITNYAIGIAIILLGFIYFLWKRKFIAAFFLPLILATQPAFLAYARAPMSEMLSVFYTLMACFLLLEYFERKRMIYYLLACATISISYLIRSQNLFFGFLLIAPIIEIKRDSQELKRLGLLFCLGLFVFIIGLIPSFYNAYVNYGSIGGTGYGYWVSGLSFDKLFGFENVPKHLLFISDNIFHITKQFSLAHMFGSGVHFSVFFIALSLISCIVIITRDVVFRVMILGVALAFLITTTYMFVSLRFYITDIVLLVFVVANFGEILYSDRGQNSIYYYGFSSIYVVGFVLMLVGYYPVVNGESVEVRYTTNEYMEKKGIGGGSYVYDVCSMIKAEMVKYQDEDILLVCNHSPVLMDIYLPNNITIIPDSKINQYMFSNEYKWTNEKTVSYIEKYREMRRPIYLLTCIVHKSRNEILEHLGSYQWEPIEHKTYMSFYRFSEENYRDPTFAE